MSAPTLYQRCSQGQDFSEEWIFAHSATVLGYSADGYPGQLRESLLRAPIVPHSPPHKSLQGTLVLSWISETKGYTLKLLKVQIVKFDNVLALKVNDDHASQGLCHVVEWVEWVVKWRWFRLAELTVIEMWGWDNWDAALMILWMTDLYTIFILSTSVHWCKKVEIALSTWLLMALRRQCRMISENDIWWWSNTPFWRWIHTCPCRKKGEVM